MKNFAQILGGIMMLVSLAMIVDNRFSNGEEGKTPEGTKEKNPSPYTFPERLPKSRIDFDKSLVQTVNKLDNPEQQLKHLIGLLPTKAAKKKVLSFPQVSAVRLLGLTRSIKAIKPLLSIIDYADIRDEHQPVPLALADLGETAVGDILNLMKTAKDRQILVPAARALQQIKGDHFPQFVESQRRKLPEEALSILQLFAASRLSD